MAQNNKTSPVATMLFFEELEPRLLLSANLEGLIFDTQDTTAPDTQSYDVVLPTDLPVTDIGTDITEPSQELIIIDSRVPNIDQLLNDIQAQQPEGRTFDVLILNAQQSGIEQIQQVITDYQDLDAIHIVSHSDSDSIFLGNEELDASNIDQYKNLLGQWGEVLNENADILIYGCDLASSEAGIALIEAIQIFTGADVAASDDLTGKAELGGDWELEHEAGEIETTIAFSENLQQDWAGVLAGGGGTPTISDLSGDTLAYSEGDGAVVIDQGSSATVTDGGMGVDFFPGNLAVSFTAGSDSAEDVLAIRNQGTGSGQIGISGSNVTYEGSTIGTFTGGSGGTDLVITFDDDATETNVSALVQNITYENTDTDAPTTGSRTVQFALTNDDNNTVYENTTVTVSGVNVAATLSNMEGTDITYTENDGAVQITSALTVADADDTNLEGATITISANYVNGEDTLSFTDQNGISGTWTAGTGILSLSGTATVAEYETALQSITYTNGSDDPTDSVRTVSFVVNDGDTDSDASTRDINVNPVNDAPTISGTPTTSVDEDSAYSFTPTTNDVEGDTLTFSIANKPSWATFDTNTGELSGTPTNADVGTTSNIVITVDDGTTTTDLASFDLTVNNTNDAPTISGTPTTSVNEDSAYSFTPTAGDVDVGDTLTFSIANKPAWATFNTSTGELSGTPTAVDAGTTSNIIISVSDGTTTTALTTFDLTVNTAAIDTTMALIAENISDRTISTNTQQDDSQESSDKSGTEAQDELEHHPDLDVKVNIIDNHITINKEMNLFEAQNPYPSVSFQPNSGTVHVQLNNDRPETLQQGLEEALKILKRELVDSSETDKSEHQLIVISVAGVSVALTAGVVSWVLKSGSLISSLAAIIPTWNSFDPLPILEIAKHTRANTKTETGDQAEEIFDKKADTQKN